MALVFPHTAGSFTKGLVGRFLGDGLEYLALLRAERYIDFYPFPECYTKVKTLDVPKEGSGEKVSYLKLYNYSSDVDYLVMDCTNMFANRVGCKYWNTTELIDLAESIYDMSFPSEGVAPGLYTSRQMKVYKENDVIYNKELSDLQYGCGRLLDESTIAIIDTDPNDVRTLEIRSLKTNRLISKWASGSDYFREPTYSYISKNDRSRVVMIPSCGGAYVLDISQSKAQDISENFNTDLGFKSCFESQFLFYDNATGFPVFFLDDRFPEKKFLSMFTDNGFVNMELAYRSYLLNNKLILLDASIYEIVVNSEKNVDLVCISSLRIAKSIEHSYRDLAGTTYIGTNGVFRESLTFKTSGKLSNEHVEPVKGIFGVGNHMVLISGNTKSVVVNTQTASEVDTWHKLESTLFACEKFQVCGSKVYAENCEAELPLPGACMFASSGDSLVVASTTEVAVISQDLNVERVISVQPVFSVFSEGFVSQSGVHFFRSPELNVPSNNTVSAQVVNGVLYTVSTSGELKCGANLARVDLMLEKVNHIRTIDDKMVISGTNDTYIYSKGEYFSIEAGDYESILVSNDNQVCVTLRDGTVYLKTNIGSRITKKKIGGTLGYNQVSVCNDMLMCVRQKSAKEIIVKHIASDVTKRFWRPNKSGDCRYILFSENHLFEYSDGKVCVYTLQNPDLVVFEEDLSADKAQKLGTLPSLQSANKVFACSRPSCSSNQWVLKHEGGKIYSDEAEYYTCDSAYSPDEIESGEVDLMYPYRLGLQPSDYPRSGNHWVIFEEATKSFYWNIRLVPKSEESVLLDKLHYIGPLIDFHRDRVSCVRSEHDPDTYYCASGKEVYKVTVDGTQETIATIRKRCGFFGSPTKYTVNHGLKTKYEPDFIITGKNIATVTILPSSEAEKLQALQKELIGDSQDADVVSEIDGRFLLSAAMDSKNEYFFTKHGIDVEVFKKDLFELFK